MGATTLKVTSKGQLTLCKGLLAHLGIQPGQHLDVQVLPGGRLKPSTSFSSGSQSTVNLLKVSF